MNLKIMLYEEEFSTSLIVREEDSEEEFSEESNDELGGDIGDEFDED